MFYNCLKGIFCIFSNYYELTEDNFVLDDLFFEPYRLFEIS